MKIVRKLSLYLLCVAIGFIGGSYKGILFYHNSLDSTEVVNNNSSTTNIEKLKTKGTGNIQDIGIENKPTQNNKIEVEAKPTRRTKKGKIGRK